MVKLTLRFDCDDTDFFCCAYQGETLELCGDQLHRIWNFPYQTDRIWLSCADTEFPGSRPMYCRSFVCVGDWLYLYMQFTWPTGHTFYTSSNLSDVLVDRFKIPIGPDLPPTVLWVRLDYWG